MEEKKVSLFFTEGSSDKEYHIQLVAAGSGVFVVNFQYGRRGGPLSTGSKTPSPVPYERALTVFDKLVREKTAKGYTPNEAGVPYQDSPAAGQASEMPVMLLNPVEERDVDFYLDSPDWGMEEKADGERRPIRLAAGNATGGNRKGLIVNLAQPIADGIAALPFSQLVIDGEDLGDAGYVAFDLLERDGLDLRHMPMLARYDAMLSVLSTLPASNTVIVGTQLYVGAAKREAFARLRAAGAEGVVFKRLDAPYTPGAPASGGDAVKFKFVESATVEIDGHSDGKRSVSMRVYDSDGCAVSVGNVTIPPNKDIPPIGTICEVQYLYMYAGGSLFQPVFLGPRRDLDASDCTLAKLKIKTDLPAAA